MHFLTVDVRQDLDSRIPEEVPVKSDQTVQKGQSDQTVQKGQNDLNEQNEQNDLTEQNAPNGVLLLDLNLDPVLVKSHRMSMKTIMW